MSRQTTDPTHSFHLTKSLVYHLCNYYVGYLTLIHLPFMKHMYL